MSLEIIQIIEDEPLHAQLLDHSLRQARYRTNVATDGVTGLADVRRLHPSIVLLDLMLPGMSGQEVCRSMRHSPATREIPIIMVSALGTEEDRISGFEMGADDYMAKPFSPSEVVSRVGTVLRRKRERPPMQASGGEAVLSVKDHCLVVLFKGKQITLSQEEWKLLEFLTARSGTIVTVEELESVIWGDREPSRDRQLDTLVRTLRIKLENNSLGTLEILPRIGCRLSVLLPETNLIPNVEEAGT